MATVREGKEDKGKEKEGGKWEGRKRGGKRVERDLVKKKD